MGWNMRENCLNPEGVVLKCELPRDEFERACKSIKLPCGIHNPFLVQFLL